jgi:hypothetical protein
MNATFVRQAELDAVPAQAMSNVRGSDWQRSQARTPLGAGRTTGESWVDWRWRPLTGKRGATPKERAAPIAVARLAGRARPRVVPARQPSSIVDGRDCRLADRGPQQLIRRRRTGREASEHDHRRPPEILTIQHPDIPIDRHDRETCRWVMSDVNHAHQCDERRPLPHLSSGRLWITRHPRHHQVKQLPDVPRPVGGCHDRRCDQSSVVRAAALLLVQPTHRPFVTSPSMSTGSVDRTIQVRAQRAALRQHPARPRDLAFSRPPSPAKERHVSPMAQWSATEIRALRHARRMSIREFATHLGMSDRAVSKWEADQDPTRPVPTTRLCSTPPSPWPIPTSRPLSPDGRQPAARRGQAARGTRLHPASGSAPGRRRLMTLLDARPCQAATGQRATWLPYVDATTWAEYEQFRLSTNTSLPGRPMDVFGNRPPTGSHSDRARVVAGWEDPTGLEPPAGRPMPVLIREPGRGGRPRDRC